MNTKQYLILAIATLAVLTALCGTASAGDYGAGCPFDNWYNGTINGGIYFKTIGAYGNATYSETFENVPDDRIIARLYGNLWLGSPGNGLITFDIAINGNTDTYSFMDDGDYPLCDVVNEPECNVDVTGCGVVSINYNATPHVVTGTNDMTGTNAASYQLSLLAIYENESMPKIQYWVKEGHEYPDGNYTLYFNETDNTGPIYTGSISSVKLWLHGYPHCPGSASWPSLNGNDIGAPDYVYSYDVCGNIYEGPPPGKEYEVVYRWDSIPLDYITSPSNSIYFPNIGNDRLMVPILMLQYGETGPNQPPVADPDGPYTGTEGTPLTFDGSGSYDTDGSIVSYDWDFGDGNTGTGVSPTHTYALEGTYTVTLTVTDNDAATDTKTTTASVADADPIADFSGSPTYGPSPLAVVFTDASTTYDGITTWEWDFDNNGVVDSTVQNPTYVYEVDGVYSVKLTVHEADGDSDSEVKVDYITVTAANIPPVADAGQDQTAAIGATVTFNGSGSYDTDGSIVSYDWDFGDGNTGTGEITTHAYSTDGTYTVTLTVTDSEGATDNDTAIVTVNPPGGYTGNHPLTIYENGTINGGLVYETITDESGYTQLWAVGSATYQQNITISIPEGATVKTARLYNYYTWSKPDFGNNNVPGVPAEADLTFSDGTTTWTRTCVHGYPDGQIGDVPNPIYYGTDAIHYWDTKGQTYATKDWDFPSGTFAWDVTDMVTGIGGTYTATITNADSTPTPDERFVTFGFGLLVVYEAANSPKVKYEVAEGCDILMARTFETPESATTSATFGGVSCAVYANMTTVVACSDKGTLEPPQNMVYFNGVEIGPSTAVSDMAIGVDYFNVTGNLQAGQNVAEFQDRDDYEAVHNAFLVVEVVSEPPVDDKANADTPVKGTVSGSYLDTHGSDNVCEAIEERESGGKPTNRYSYLEHKWTIDVTGGTDATFYVEAYHTANGEGDDFVFEYSKDDSTYTPMVTVIKTADDDTYQTYSFTEPISGTVYIRVRDTDRTAGNKVLDTISIDHMFIRSVSAPPGDKMHVASIDMTLNERTAGPNTFTHATAIVTIVDANGVAVEGAAVSGHWSGATSDTDSGITDASGQVSLDSDEVKSAASGTTFTFTVDDVVLTGWTYDSAANVETSDSISIP